MEARVAIFARLVCVLLGLQLLFLDLGAEAGRWGMVAPDGDISVQEAPELPVCDFKHHSIGVDCSGWPHAPDFMEDYVRLDEIAPPGPSGGPAILDTIQAIDPPPPPPPVVDLPPCKYKWQFPGYDHTHQNHGVDCSGSPPAVADHLNQETESAAGSAGALPDTHSCAHVQAQLPPCKFYGAIPGWNCYDPPKEPLPPCTDFKHQRPGFDCWPSSPPAAATAVTQSGHEHRQWAELPLCNFPDALPGRDCYDPPQGDLPPCDFDYQRPGFDCWPSPPPSPPS